MTRTTPASRRRDEDLCRAHLPDNFLPGGADWGGRLDHMGVLKEVLPSMAGSQA